MTTREKITKSVLRALSAYAVLSLCYTGILAAVNRNNTAVAALGEHTGFFIGVLAAMLLFSAVFGFSFYVFYFKLLPSAAKRFLHIVVMFVDTAFLCAVIASPQTGEKNRVMFWFIAVILYLIVYGLAWLGGFIVKKIKNRT